MKQLFTLLLLVNTLTILHAQTDNEIFEPIGKQIRNLQPLGTIYYGDHAYRKTFQKFYALLKYSVYKSTWDSINERLTLTPKEKSYIQTELSKQERQLIPNGLFEDSKRMKSDKLIQFVDSLNLVQINTVSNLPDSVRTFKVEKSFKKYWSFIFTKPIYLRDETIALYYFMYYSLSGGAEFCWFYKKDKNLWKRWILVPGLNGAW